MLGITEIVFAYLFGSFWTGSLLFVRAGSFKIRFGIYVLNKENRPVLCYLLEYEKDWWAAPWSLEECIEYISGDDKEVRFIMNFTAFLLKKTEYGADEDYLEVQSENEWWNLREK